MWCVSYLEPNLPTKIAWTTSLITPSTKQLKTPERWVLMVFPIWSWAQPCHIPWTAKWLETRKRSQKTWSPPTSSPSVASWIRSCATSASSSSSSWLKRFGKSHLGGCSAPFEAISRYFKYGQYEWSHYFWKTRCHNSSLGKLRGPTTAWVLDLKTWTSGKLCIVWWLEQHIYLHG